MSAPLELISGYFDGQLTDEQFEELVSWINADLSNAAEFARASADHSILRDLWYGEDMRAFFGESGVDGLELLTGKLGSGKLGSDKLGSAATWPVSPDAIAELLDESEAEAEAVAERQRAAKKAKAKSLSASRPVFQRERRERPLRPEPIVIPWSVVYAVGAAALVGFVQLAHGLWSQWEREARPATVPQQAIVQRAPIATIANSIEATWGIPTVSTKPGTPLTEGPISLVNGVVELEFGGGARLVVESPADFELLSADRVKLLHGKVVGKVPREAIGFTVEAPTATVIDLGTEFGVIANESGTSEIHVLDGVVELVSQNNANTDRAMTRSRLTAGSAVEVDQQGQVAQLELQAEKFHLDVPATAIVQREVLAAADIRLVDLDGDGRGDRVDQLDQPPPPAEASIVNPNIQSSVGVGEKNHPKFADRDARRYSLKFDLADFNAGEFPNVRMIDKVELAFAISEKKNVSRLRVDVYGLHDPLAMDIGPSCFEAGCELLKSGAIHARTRLDVLQKIDVTDFVKEQLREGESSLVFRIQAAGVDIPNNDGVRNVFVFHTRHTQDADLAPKLQVSAREYVRSAE